MKYRPDIDGLRAVAILPVVFYHAGIAGFGGGYVGVDVFFVISGYLITGIIAASVKERNFSLSEFYLRRVRRLFPALFTVLAVCSVVALVFYYPDDLKNYAESLAATTLFGSNFYFWGTADYFAPDAETMPLLHTWSLAVEEQFYILYPVFLIALFRVFGRQSHRSLLIAVLLSLSLMVSVWGVYTHPVATFYLAPARAWELLSGAVIALGVVPALRTRAGNEVLAMAGIGLILVSVLTYSDATPFPGAYAILPCLGAVLIIHTGQNQATLVRNVLGYGPFVFVGMISYSLYLWHWPLLVFNEQLAGGEYRYGAVVLAILLSVLSWKFVETPYRRRDRYANKVVLVGATAAVATSLCISLAVHALEGVPARFTGELVKLEFDYKKYNISTCFLRPEQEYREWQEQSCFITKGNGAKGLLWGDSFAAHYVPGIKKNLANADTRILQYTASGCAPVLGYSPAYRPNCREFNEKANIRRLLAAHHIDYVVLAARWSLAVHHGLDLADVGDTIRFLQSEGVKVFLIGESPVFESSVEKLYNDAISSGRKVESAVPREEGGGINAELANIAGADQFFNPRDVICKGVSCVFLDRGGFLFWDSGHLTEYGSDKVIGRFIVSKKLI